MLVRTRFVRCLLVMSVIASMLLASVSFEGIAFAQSGINEHKSEIAIIKRIWASPSYLTSSRADRGYGKAYYIDYINTIPSDKMGAYMLYNIQVHLMNFLLMAIDYRETGLLSDLSDVALAAYPYLRASDGSYPLREKEIAKIDLSKLTWLYDDGVNRSEDLVVTVQWLYFVSTLVNGVVSIPEAERTRPMNLLLSRYTPLLKAAYARLLFAESDPDDPQFSAVDPFNMGDLDRAYGFIGWSSCVSNPVMDYKYHKHAFRTVEIKLQEGYSKSIKYCNQVLDQDIQLLAGVVEYMAANAKDPDKVIFDEPNRNLYLEYFDNAIAWIEKLKINPLLPTYSGKISKGFAVGEGALSEHPSYRWAGYENYTSYKDIGLPPTETTPLKKVPRLGDDVSHFVRYSWVLRTLYFNRSLTGSDFPQRTDLEGLANQLAYAVFDGNFDKPNFHTFMDGSNGWYRAYPRDNHPGVPPFSGAQSMITGGYLLYSSLNDDLQKVADRFWTLFKMDPSRAENKPYIDLINSYHHFWVKSDGNKCEYDLINNRWLADCARKNYPLGLDPAKNMSGELFRFLSAYVNIRPFPEMNVIEEEKPPEVVMEEAPPETVVPDEASDQQKVGSDEAAVPASGGCSLRMQPLIR